MISELNLAFKEYIEEFKKLTTSEKRMELVDSIKELSGIIDSLAERENKNLEYLKSKEISKLNNGFESEDDFLEALLVYVENSKNLIGQYLIDKI